jgi:hypothetical protein
MTRNREMSDPLWILALPVTQRLKATSGERVLLGILIALAAPIVVLLTSHVIANPDATLH